MSLRQIRRELVYELLSEISNTCVFFARGLTALYALDSQIEREYCLRSKWG